jgi:hypothetical protein
MEQQIAEQVRTMRRVGFPIGGWFRMAIIFALSGMVCGLAVAGLLYRRLTAPLAGNLISWGIAALCFIQLVMLCRLHVTFRREMKQMRADFDAYLDRTRDALLAECPEDREKINLWIGEQRRTFPQ